MRNMGEIVNGTAMILNILTLLCLYGGLALIVLTLRKLTREVADLKRSVSDLEAAVTAQTPPAGPV
jgi:hypothetical protein